MAADPHLHPPDRPDPGREARFPVEPTGDRDVAAAAERLFQLADSLRTLPLDTIQPALEPPRWE